MKKLSPYALIASSFLIVIIIGTLLLKSPISSANNNTLSWIDALFTSTSAVTITGLFPIDPASSLSTFGHVILILLIKIGGLSITTITLFVIVTLGLKLGFGSRYFLKESLNISSFKGLVIILKRVVVLSLIVELIGTILFTIFFLNEGLSFQTSIGYGIFHAISAYNNAGFSIIPLSSGIIPYSSSPFFSIVTILLIILGGLGALVIFDVLEKKSYKKLTTHSKIVLNMTLFLLLFGTITILLLEDNISILAALTHSALARTAGFSMIDYRSLGIPVILITSLLMFIGAAPTSTAGGVKVTTFYTAFKGVSSFVRQKDAVVNHKKIPVNYILKAFSIITISIIIIFTSIIIIQILEPNQNLTALIFEVFSAFSNTGASRNLTSNLNDWSKIVLIINMFIGRVGIMTLISLIFYNMNKKVSHIDYVDASYILG